LSGLEPCFGLNKGGRVKNLKIIGSLGGTLVLILALSACDPKTDDTTDDSTVVRTEEWVDFTISTNSDGDCEIRDENHLRVIKVSPGDYVVWKNETSSKQMILFHEDPSEHFGVRGLEIPPGESIPLRVLDSAKVDPENAQTFDSCDPGDAPPGFIICPPGGC